MVYAPNSGRSRSIFARSFKLGLRPDAGGAEPDSPPQRDLKKLILIIGLGTLSWVATYVGMLELIQANMGDLPLIHKIIIGFSVAMLMTMIVWLLDQMFSPIGPATRLAYFAGYLFLSLISVGFGFGFYWKVLESRAESSRSAELAVTGVQTSLNAASTRLEQLNATLVQLAAVSRQKAETERDKGTSCPNSKPGDGPRRRMRDEDAQRFSFASEFVAGRVSAVKADMAALDGDLVKIAKNDPAIIDPKSGTRNEFMKGLGRKLDMTVSSFNALRSDPQLQQLRQDLATRADQSTFGDPKKGGFVCPDAELGQALRGAVRAIAELPVLETPVIAAVEGSEATIEAFRRLTTTFYGLLSFKLPPSADELRELQKKAIQSVEQNAPPPPSPEGGGLSQRDYVPLAVAIFVDICLLLVSIGRPGHRLHGLVPKMREAERGPVIEILSRFNDIHRDPEIRESFELFRHVVFDLHGAYYVAVPLDAPPHLGAEEREALRTEAQLLANLFTSFEKDRIFKRTWAPFNGAIRKKLARQGSKFAASEAFRVYKFRDGAWSEIILGAVMGAARRAEAEENRRRIEREILRPGPFVKTEPRFTDTGPTTHARNAASQAPRASQPERASLDPATYENRSHEDRKEQNRTRETATRSERTEPSLSAHQNPPTLRKASAPAAEIWRTSSFRYATAQPADTTGFGPYARSAAAELSTSLDVDEDLSPPANSNTAPVQATKTETMPLPTAESKATHAPSAEAAAPDVILLPQAPVVSETAALEPVAPAAPRVDVVLKRETATVSLPLEQASDQNGLIGRLTEALGVVEPPHEKKSLTVLPVSDGEPAANETPKEIHQLEYVVTDTEDDVSMNDVATMASRLRPALRNA